MISASETVMGTVFSFLVDPGHLTREHVDRALDEARAELHGIDDRFSTWKPESELSRLRSREIDQSSDLMDEVYELCARVFESSSGFYDPWKMPGGFDPTGLVKGWAAERALSILSECGISDGLINAGGDVSYFPASHIGWEFATPGYPMRSALSSRPRRLLQPRVSTSEGTISSTRFTGTWPPCPPRSSENDLPSPMPLRRLWRSEERKSSFFLSGLRELRGSSSIRVAPCLRLRAWTSP